HAEQASSAAVTKPRHRRDQDSMIISHETCTDDPRDHALPSALNADHALRICARAWGFPGSAAADDSPWLWLEPGWRDRLVGSVAESQLPEPAKALDCLRQSHRLQCRADLELVHESWWARALQDESPAVRHLVAAHGPPQVRDAVRTALGLSSTE